MGQKILSNFLPNPHFYRIKGFCNIKKNNLVLIVVWGWVYLKVYIFFMVQNFQLSKNILTYIRKRFYDFEPLVNNIFSKQFYTFSMGPTAALLKTGQSEEQAFCTLKRKYLWKKSILRIHAHLLKEFSYIFLGKPPN